MCRFFLFFSLPFADTTVRRTSCRKGSAGAEPNSRVKSSTRKGRAPLEVCKLVSTPDQLRRSPTMKSVTFIVTALLAAADAMADKMPNKVVARQELGVQVPKTRPQRNKATSQGCFKTSGDMKNMGVRPYMSIGKCGDEICRGAGYLVGGTTEGDECWCGNKYPPESDLVDDEKCDEPCTGFGEHACELRRCGGMACRSWRLTLGSGGGIGYWSIYNTGLELKVDYLEGSSSSSSATSTSSSVTSVVTVGGETIIVTQGPDSDDSGDGGPNVGGIVAGVVVAVVLIAAAIGGGFLYMRHKRNKEIEEEHRRNAAVNAFIGKPGSSSGTSMTDSRLDPIMVQRRLSDGSIADNQDYSRRILRVSLLFGGGIRDTLGEPAVLTQNLAGHQCIIRAQSDDDKRLACIFFPLLTSASSALGKGEIF